MINMDDPEHQAQRNLVSRRFTPRAVRNHEEHVRGIATEILDEVAPLGECEAIEAIASRLPAIVIGDLLGYPREMWERVRYWSEQIMLLAGQTSPDGPPHVIHPGHPAGDPGVRRGHDPSSSRQRRAEPRDDLISLWANTEGWDTGHVLDETMLVLDGGAETTRTVIGSMIRELALQPDQRQLLLDRPELLATTAVEEFIRWVSPVLNMRRTVDRRPRAPRPAAPRGRRAPPACTARRTATRGSFDRSRRARRDAAPTTATSRSGSARTSASARTWPGSRSG